MCGFGRRPVENGEKQDVLEVSGTSKKERTAKTRYPFAHFLYLGVNVKIRRMLVPCL